MNPEMMAGMMLNMVIRPPKNAYPPVPIKVTPV
jgi:hypothetical protein